MHISTFSIVAHDPDEQAWGIAVASKFLAVGAVVSWAQAGAGAIATQAYARVSYGQDGLTMLTAGKSASETLAALLKDDPQREQRQIGLVDAQGRSAAHTGKLCHEWAGHRTGPGFTCQGNLIDGPDTLDAMADAFTAGTGELADRLMSALQAGEAAGGDRRGRQSAAMLVVREGGGYGGDNDRYLDLRVDDAEQPLRRLRDLITMHRLYFGAPNPNERIPIDENIARELQEMMVQEGYLGGEVNGEWDEITQQAFWGLIGNENLEGRWNLEDQPDKIDRVALDYLRKRFK